MRLKKDYQQTFDIRPAGSVKVVRDCIKKYDQLDQWLRSMPFILDHVHADFEKGLSESDGGRSAIYTSDEIFRAILIMTLEQYDYREAIKNLDLNDVFRSFAGLNFKPVMDPGFLCKAYGCLAEQTWIKINRLLSEHACRQGRISGKKLRLDSTAVESNIHYPTDSSLLWDSYRTMARLMRKLKDEMRAAGLRHRFHTKKIKKLATYISRHANSSKKRTQQKVKRTYRTLIERVTNVLRVAQTTVARLDGQGLALVEQLDDYAILVECVIDQAERRIFQGETVPAHEKIYSLFEEHTELIKRGKPNKPVEFGHKVLLAQNENKFITHYQVLPEQKEDQDLLKGAVEAHKKLFQQPPSLLATDRGFYKGPNQLNTLRQEINTVSMPKKGTRTESEKDLESSDAFREGQRFRAGSEGSISVLKRAYKMKKCLFKGYKNFAASVGCAVFCHNLVLLTQL